MSEPRNIKNSGDGGESTPDERLLEALLAEMPRHKCPPHVRGNILAALKEEQRAGVSGREGGGARVVTVWLRRHSARMLQAAAVLLFAFVGIEVYLDLRESGKLDDRAVLAEFRDRHPGGSPAVSTPASGRETAAEGNRLARTKFGTVLEASDGVVDTDFDLAGDPGARESKVQNDDRVVRYEYLRKAESDRPIASRASAGARTESGQTKTDSQKLRAAKPEPKPAASPSAETPVKPLPALKNGSPAGDLTDQLGKGLSGPVPEAERKLEIAHEKPTEGVEKQPRKQSKSGSGLTPTEELRSLTEAVEDETYGRRSRLSGRGPGLAGEDVREKSVSDREGAVAHPTERKRDARTDGPGEAAGTPVYTPEYEKRRSRGVTLEPQRRGRGFRGRAYDLSERPVSPDEDSRRWNWFEVDTADTVRKELALRNTIGEMQFPEKGPIKSGVLDRPTTWAVFADYAIGSFNELAEGFDGYIAQSRDVLVQPGNRRAILVECVIPPANSVQFYEAANNRRMVVAARVADDKAVGTGGTYGLGLKRKSGETADAYRKETSKIRKVTEADIANGTVQPVTNYYVQVVPAEEEKRLRARTREHARRLSRLTLDGDEETSRRNLASLSERGTVSSEWQYRERQEQPATGSFQTSRSQAGWGQAEQAVLVRLFFVLEPDSMSPPAAAASAAIKLEE